MAATRHIHARSIAVLAAGYVVGFAAYPNLLGPFLDQARFARVLVAFTLPTTALVIYSLFRSLWRHDRVRSGNGAFEHTYHAIVLRVLLFVLALHTLVVIELTGALSAVGLDTSPGRATSAGRAVVVLLGVVLVAIGNLLPRTRPNVAVGVRTKRTLSNPLLWQQVHRAGGYTTVALGIVIAVTGLVLTHTTMGAVVSAAALAAAMTVIVSYRRYARA
ncbi:MAG TPA: SdpI family protein [Vicinamibacterales bacterium]|nr:SdpI family protein [Vicinamibacterales bacterium]